MHVMMKAIDFCNLACTYCYVPEEQRKNRNSMRIDDMPEIFTKVLDWNQSEWPGDDLSFNWSGGEVLSLPLEWWQETLQIQRDIYCRGNYDFQIRNGIQTNLTLMTDEKFKLLNKYDFGIGVSIDGPKDCMDKTRTFPDGSSAFDIVIKKLKRMINDYNFIPGAIVVLNKNNVDYIEDIFKMFNELRIGFQINSYHYAPSSVDNESHNALTPQHFLKAMCRLYDIWSSESDSVDIGNFTRAIKYLITGRVNLCLNQPSCCNYFYMIRHNGDVYPCNEFSGSRFEQDYCYGNILQNTWQEISQHTTRKTMMGRADKILQIHSKCKDCRYWTGCHGGCFHCALKMKYRYSDDYFPPDDIVTTPDSEHCVATYGLYEHIENCLRETFRTNQIPVHFHADKINQNFEVRRRSFYNYQISKDREYRVLIKGDDVTLRESLISRSFGQKLCLGSTILLLFVKDLDIFLRIVNAKGLSEDTDAIDFHKLSQMENGLWQLWLDMPKRNMSVSINPLLEDLLARSYDTIIMNLSAIYEDDIPGTLKICRERLSKNGELILYMTQEDLNEYEYLDISFHPIIKKYIPHSVAINHKGISIMVLDRSDIKLNFEEMECYEYAT